MAPGRRCGGRSPGVVTWRAAPIIIPTRRAAVSARTAAAANSPGHSRGRPRRGLRLSAAPAKLPGVKHTFRGLCDMADVRGWRVALYTTGVTEGASLFAVAVFTSLDDKKAGHATACCRVTGKTLDEAAWSCCRQLEQAKLL